MYFMNLPISIILDSLLRLFGRSPLLMKVQRRIMYSVELTKNYASRIYDIPYNNLLNLENYVPPSER